MTKHQNRLDYKQEIADFKNIPTKQTLGMNHNTITTEGILSVLHNIPKDEPLIIH